MKNALQRSLRWCAPHRMPLPEAPPDNADRQPANLVLNRSFQTTCCKSATLIVLSLLIGLEATEAGPPQLRLTSRATLPSKRANEYCRPARRRVPRRLGAQILIPLYFVRCLTFNNFSVLFPRPTERRRQDPAPRTRITFQRFARSSSPVRR